MCDEIDRCIYKYDISEDKYIKMFEFTKEDKRNELLYIIGADEKDLVY